MLFMLTNRTRPGLTPQQFGELAALAKKFYASVPAGVTLRGEWAAADHSVNYSLIEAPDLATVQQMQAPFAAYTETLIVPVNSIRGWVAS